MLCYAPPVLTTEREVTELLLPDSETRLENPIASTGSVTDTYEYDAFGSVIARSGTTDNAFTYTGEQVDSALGLLYLRARWMDTGKGRFWTRDSFEDTGAINHLFSCSAASPTDNVDPDGQGELSDGGVPEPEGGSAVVNPQKRQGLSLRKTAPAPERNYISLANRTETVLLRY